MKLRIKPAVAAGIVAVIGTALASHLRNTSYNNYVLLAQALLHGHVWVDPTPSYIDALQYAGRYYIIEAPMPAILLLPFAAFFGPHTNQTLLAIALCGISIYAAWEIGERLGLSAASNAWICAFLLLGTDLLWCAMLGDVWFIAHVSAVCFTMLALLELLGKRRGALVALWAFCAFESRFTMILALPVYAYLLYAEPPDSPCHPEPVEEFDLTKRTNLFRGPFDRLRVTLGGFVGMLLPLGLLWAIYNHARWGTWVDIGYTQWYHQDSWGQTTGSPFRLSYFPYQIWSFFIQGPTLEEYRQQANWPIFKVDPHGIALTFTSPALLLAFFARAPRPLTIAMWTAAVLCAIPNFFYYLDGWTQYGMRHALDFEPFLIVLMMLASRTGVPVWARYLIAWSCAMGIWGTWFWNATYRTGD